LGAKTVRAMILAAGLGTRLKPITDSMPKPLVPVVGTPNIVRTIQNLKSHGIREIVINCHHLPDVLKRALKDGSELGLSIQYSDEKELLGTGGGIKKALCLLGDSTFVVVNGDSLFAPDINRAVKFHRQKRALATLLLREDPEVGEYGAIGIDKNGRVCSMVGSGDIAGAVDTRMFTGVHVLEPEIGKLLPDNGCIVRETYLPLIEQGSFVFGLTDNSCFFDLGTPKRYLAANIALVTGKAGLPGFSPPENGVYVGEAVALGKGCELGPGAVICDGARIADSVRIERAVVMPDAFVDQNLSDAIIAIAGEIVPAV
jgi:NDP-sugar pyrophosphorylase family protein